MLYVTTRDNKDAYTAQRVLCEEASPDGGRYVPMRLLPFSTEEIHCLMKISSLECMAQIINYLFNTRLTRWDLEFAAGRNAVRFRQMGQKILISECWHNIGWTFNSLADSLAKIIRVPQNEGYPMGEWARVGIGIAAFFGIFSELYQNGIISGESKVDISVAAGDFVFPTCAWYARFLGLPIGEIICSCKENSGLWELFCQGQLPSGRETHITDASNSDVAVPRALERLIYYWGGTEEAKRFGACCEAGTSYFVGSGMSETMSAGFHISVISQPRVMSTIPNVFTTHGYLMSPCTAAAYAGLLDFRAKNRGGRPGIILSGRSPACDLVCVANALRVQPSQLKEYIDKM